MAKNRFITGYSGLRALAVIGVILYHLDPNTFIGGYLGVPIFFVLSGYLVTCQMLKAYYEEGFFNNKKFYLGRLKKLYPPLIAVLWLSAAYILLFQRNLLVKLSQIVVTNLLNVYNFWQILNGQSYFERFTTNESPFVHLWTMSINGQFYFLWPIVIFLLFKYAKKRKNIFWILFSLSILSAIEMAILFRSGVDINRIYYGTDTRFFSLGIGAAFAVIWPMDKLKSSLKQKETNFLDLVGLVALVGMLLLFFSRAMNPENAFPYYGGLLLFTVLTVILVGIIAHPCSHWNRWLTNPVFNWLGSRSYGIYLYQFPVMIFFEDKVMNMADHVFLYHMIEIALILVFSELSYRLIEKPLGKISLQKTQNFFINFFDHNTKNYFLKLQVIVSGLILLVGTAAICISPTVKAEDFNKSQLARRITSNQKKQKIENKAVIAKMKKVKKKAEKRAKLVKEAKTAAKKHPVNQDFLKYGVTQVELQMASRVGLTAVGDSVMAGASNDLSKLMPKAVIDAAVSRQLNAAFGLFNSYKQQKVLANNVLVALGTNGPFPMSDLDYLMSELGSKRQVFWINTHVPTKPWQNQVNNRLQAASKRYHNLIIIDWYKYSRNHPDWFYQDKTHPTPVGSKYYSALIVKTIVEHAKY